jgi:hypothetical protein
MQVNPPTKNRIPKPAAQVAADVGADGQAAERQRDQSHDLPEHGSGAVPGQRYGAGERGSRHGATFTPPK